MSAIDLQGKTALVTGASAGIGAAAAVELARRGVTVAICARRGDRLAEVLAHCREHAPESRSWTIDLADLDGIAPFAADVEAALGRVDLLVNNAGIPKRRHVRDLTVAEVETVMTVNYLAPIRLTLALLPGMLARDFGRVFFVASVAARLGPPRETAYAASKAAIVAFAESMSIDLDGTGVETQLFQPGVIDTELFELPDNEATLADLERLPVGDAGRAIADQLADGAFERYLPDWFPAVVAHKFTDVEGFLEGNRAWTRMRVEQLAGDVST